jgi:hypothetical protein
MEQARRVVPDLVERDVSATMAEFARGLAMAFPDAGIPERVGESARIFEIAFEGGRCDIAAAPGPIRQIALLQLPTLRVKIAFCGGDESRRSALLTHMDLVMRRGGG